MKQLRALLIVLGLGGALGIALVPMVGGFIVRTRVLPLVSARIGRSISVETVWVGWGRTELRSLTVDGEGHAPPIVLPLIQARFRMAPLFTGRVVIDELEIAHARVSVARGGADDNITSLVDHLRADRAKSSSDGVGHRRLHIAHVRVSDAALALSDELLGELTIEGASAELSADGPGQLVLRDLSLRALTTGLDDPSDSAGPRSASRGAKLKAKSLRADLNLKGWKLDGLPVVALEGGQATPFAGLSMSAIHGAVRADPADARRAMVELRGSYGGAETELWNATGFFHLERKEGELHLRAARFRLSQLASVLNGAEILNARDAEADGRVDLTYVGEVLTYSGRFHLAGLTVAHPMLAPVPVERLGFDAHAQGTLDLKARRLKLTEAVVDFRNVHATLTADVENLSRRPRFNARLQVRPLPCQVALAALPAELTPSLQGFKVSGTFSTDLHLGLDFEDLETPIDLGGKVGIEGCKVVEAPPPVDSARLMGTFIQTVQLEPGKWLSFFVGPDNPDWVPYSEISQHLINSIMTTEDNGFFRHHGFIPSEFRSALQQNLQRGYFRLGASSITMQMVKNVLLSREKTLSRKLQEMFLTWYLEHGLTKERILEIYFNVIEFGPGIYGIGRAAHHYFGKPAKELAPQEAAFFSSILPSPKRRYVQYCHANGQLDAKWDAYIKRIMRRSHERERLTDEEFETALATPLKFDRTEAMPERECLAFVKRITTPLVPAPTPKSTP